MNLAVLHPLALALLPLALLPLFFTGRRTLACASLGLIPADAVSSALELVLRLAGAGALVALSLGISGLYRPAYQIERIGQGAQMILLVDRSRSMDEAFAGQDYAHPLSSASRATAKLYTSKGQTARALLSKFVSRRNDDMFGMLLFSSFPIPILSLTQKQGAVQAAIAAGNVGRGLAETDIGAGLERALGFFANQPYTGSRIVVLVSDGAGELNRATRLRITNLMQSYRVALYWIYIRSVNSPELFDNDASSGNRITPEHALHAFFSDMGAPYRAYTAENPADLERAIADVGRLQNLPIYYADVIPRKDLSAWCFASAWLLLMLLLVAKLLEAKSW